ncbi:hypothetical protein GOP47_0021036 [Adiantum capillus-veneris]|uniref:Endoglucanase n=1 Tax=Adiantum capillus-veneris TaxID=13818 RepID=A0A9D4UC58_ADICA|nr:hypothetical protein GOP47_0021036 [Adiantum capillus-veneris]
MDLSSFSRVPVIHRLDAFILPNSRDTSLQLHFHRSEALSKCILFFESQRSGKLPPDQRVTWRGDSALLDGGDYNVDLVGGYYDAGDNVKFGFPMAFTITVLSWGALEYTSSFAAIGELDNLRAAIKWGTDYLLKASVDPLRLWVQVGNAEADHECWERPESMDTPRIAFQINATSPGSEVAAETAAALASASLVYQAHDTQYSALLLDRASKLFHFADLYRASYTNECPFYCSYSGYNDELLWAAAWLFKGSSDQSYLHYIRNGLQTSCETAEFSWDNKYAGFAVMLSKMYLEGEDSLKVAKWRADNFMCVNLPGNRLTRVARTPGGLIYLRSGANTQYASGAAFLAGIYGTYLLQSNQTVSINCGDKNYSTVDLLDFARGQVDYILGLNPWNLSYMVGFGPSYPLQVHHRGASIDPSESAPSMYTTTMRQCEYGFEHWFGRAAPNPNVVVGAIVGGPDPHDGFNDVRSNSVQLEPTTYTNALFAGALARFIQSR